MTSLLGWNRRAKTFKQKVVVVKNFLAITDTRMMSLEDNQAASSPPRPRSQVLMFQKGERPFSLADQKQPHFFRHLIKGARKEPTFLELQARLHTLGGYPKRKRPSAWLLCCSVSKIHMKSPPHPSFGSHHCHCVQTQKKKKNMGRGEEGGVEGKRRESYYWTIPCFHRISVTKCCSMPGSCANKLWQVWSLVKRAAVAG